MTTKTMELTQGTAMTDMGLLILRIATGATMLQAGLIKAFDFGTTAGFMESGGWRMPTFAAAALLFTGAGTLSVDHRVFGRSRLSLPAAAGLAALGVVVAIVTWIALNGTNPIHFTAPPA